MNTLLRNTSVLFLILLTLSVKGYAANPCCDSTIDFKAGYFVFANSKMRDVYNNGGLDLQLNGTTPLYNCFQLFGGIEYMQRRGHSLDDNFRTKIWKIPVSIGIKSSFQLCRWIFYYITVGPRYVYVNLHNNSPFTDRNQHRNGFGGFVGTGFTLFPDGNFIIELFTQYSYEKVRFHTSDTPVNSKSLQMGGYVFGGSLGYAF